VFSIMVTTSLFAAQRADAGRLGRCGDGDSLGRSRGSVRDEERVAQSHANAFLGELNELVLVVAMPTVGRDAAQLGGFRDRDDAVQLDYAELVRVGYAGDWVTRSIRRRGEPAFR
jgi:hypothetical protein